MAVRKQATVATEPVTTVDPKRKAAQACIGQAYLSLHRKA
jgi:hypothetical protein